MQQDVQGLGVLLGHGEDLVHDHQALGAGLAQQREGIQGAGVAVQRLTRGLRELFDEALEGGAAEVEPQGAQVQMRQGAGGDRIAVRCEDILGGQQAQDAAAG
ncbi:hypothetical protein [Streptomyces rochei]|uniref:hypothetical protein n=1 Tax=Streptomyces rochei TaxID=1928 RepID=UPI0033AC6EAD